jgi:hypothetical protein
MYLRSLNNLKMKKMKNKISFGLIAVALIVLAVLNVGIASKGNVAVLNLQKTFKTASANPETGETQTALVKTVLTGTALQTRIANGVQQTRTCNYIQIVCTGTGSVECVSDFDYSNCTEWS